MKFEGIAKSGRSGILKLRGDMVWYTVTSNHIRYEEYGFTVVDEFETNCNGVPVFANKMIISLTNALIAGRAIQQQFISLLVKELTGWFVSYRFLAFGRLNAALYQERIDDLDKPRKPWLAGLLTAFGGIGMGHIYAGSALKGIFLMLFPQAVFFATLIVLLTYAANKKSNDSRFWGFVSQSTVIGKAYSIYMSWDRSAFKVRWDRIGKHIK